MTPSSKPNPDLFLIVTDGACSGNPGPGAWATILASDEHVREMVGFEEATTNNRMELTAVLRGLEAALKSRLEMPKIRIVLDSAYVADGAQKHLQAWKRRAWKTVSGTDVANRDLWEALDAVLERLDAKLGKNALEWKWVRGHSGWPANERANTLATECVAQRGAGPEVFAGPRNNYPVDLDAEVAGKAYYLSWVAGTFQVHTTWAECEKRVKGRAGAKYKKVHSSLEEQALRKAWKPV